MQIHAGVFLGWGFLSLLLAVLPAIALNFNRQTVSIISAFLTSGHGDFQDVLPSIVKLGVILTMMKK